MKLIIIIDSYSFWDEWAFLILIAFVLMGCYVSGFRKGKVYSNREEKSINDITIVSSIQSGLMSLLGIMLAFSFSVSSSRYEERRALLNQESLSIGTAYFRVGLLNDITLRNNLRSLLKNYLDAKIRFYNQYQNRSTEQEKKSLENELINLQIAIWAKSARVGKQSPNVNTSLIIQSLNQIIDVSDSITSALKNRAPATIMYILIFIAIVTFFTTGFYHAFANDMKLKFSISIILIVCSILMLIIDLDRPLTGIVNMDTSGLDLLKSSLERYGDLNPSDKY